MAEVFRRHRHLGDLARGLLVQSSRFPALFAKVPLEEQVRQKTFQVLALLLLLEARRYDLHDGSIVRTR